MTFHFKEFLSAKEYVYFFVTFFRVSEYSLRKILDKNYSTLIKTFKIIVPALYFLHGSLTLKVLRSQNINCVEYQS